jgi:hypothetical protein
VVVEDIAEMIAVVVEGISEVISVVGSYSGVNCGSGGYYRRGSGSG